MPNCRDIQRAIDAASKRDDLAMDIQEHLAGCGDCRQHATSTFQLMNLLMAQPRVEAPPDFDFRLRARIARARDEQRGWRSAIAQFWTNSFSWTQAGAAAVVLMAITLSASFYLTRNRHQSIPGEIAKTQLVTTPQPTQPGIESRSQQPLQGSQVAIQDRATEISRPASRPGSLMAALPVSAGPAATEIARVDLPGSQEILVYQPGQSGRPARSRSIVVPRRGQMTFGAQLASVRDVNSRPAQSTIETF